MAWAITSTILFAISALWAAAEANAGHTHPRVYVAFFLMLFLAMVAGEAWDF